MSCRESTTSTPTSLASAVSTATSATNDLAGRARPYGGTENTAANPAA